jgi:hypothetical protein
VHGDGISCEIGLAVASASRCEDAGMAHSIVDRPWTPLALARSPAQARMPQGREIQLTCCADTFTHEISNEYSPLSWRRLWYPHIADATRTTTSPCSAGSVSNLQMTRSSSGKRSAVRSAR